MVLSKLDGVFRRCRIKFYVLLEKTNDNNRFTENVCILFAENGRMPNEMNNNSNEQIHGNGTDNEQFMIIVCSPNVECYE